MSERGVFAIDRGAWEHDFLADDQPFSRREAWFWLVSEAAWKPHRRRILGRQIELTRGQYCGSFRFIASKWRWSEARVRRFVSGLISEAMVVATTDAGVTVITICNYDRYQRVSLPSDAMPEIDVDAGATQERRKVEDKEDKETPSLRSGVSAQPAKPKRARARAALPDDWALDEQDIGYAAERGFDQPEIVRLGIAFANYHRSHGNLMADWHAAWRTWTDNEVKFRGRNGNGSSNIRTHPTAQQSGSSGIIAGVAAAAERRARERAAAGRDVGPAPDGPGVAEGNAPGLFGEVGDPPTYRRA